MYVNKLFWSVPKIEVVRGEYSKNSENYHEQNNDVTSDGNENEKKHNVDSRNLQAGSGYDDNQNIEPNSNILSVQPPCPQSQSQSRTILLPLGGKYYFWWCSNLIVIDYVSLHTMCSLYLSFPVMFDISSQQL